MEFRIADTFTSSLAKLSGEDQKLVKTTAFDLQMYPANPGHQFHKLDKAKDPNFWSVRVGRDIRLIVHRTGMSLLLCYVDHHDDAYRWAERRKLETHPTTGAAQMVEIRETIREVEVPHFVPVEVEHPAQSPTPPTPGKKLFQHVPVETLLSYGVPPDWIETVLDFDEDSLLAMSPRLPQEAAEALLELAVGGTPIMPVAAAKTADPFEHPDAQRRFRTVTGEEELAMALDYPWDKWAVFLHPAQRELVDRDFSGPARVAGSAGTGKTVVALHRAVSLTRRNPDSNVLLTTFSPVLAALLRSKVKRLIEGEPRFAERLVVEDMDSVGRRLYQASFGPLKLASPETVAGLILAAATQTPGHGFSDRFLLAEWTEVVDAWQLTTWEQYRDVQRLGRKTRLPETRRASLWSIFERVLNGLKESGATTMAGVFTRLAGHIAERKHPPYDHIVVDEAQDVSVAQLRFLAAAGENRPNSLFFAGDLGQRIFQAPFSWMSIGVDVRGRSRTLSVNYRTSHQIRTHADRLLGPSIADVDGIIENRRGTVSVFNGPMPIVIKADSESGEEQIVAEWLKGLLKEGLSVGEIAVFVRSPNQFDRAVRAITASGHGHRIQDGRLESGGAEILVSTMHMAKGLEFRAVVVMACDDEIIPLQERIEEVSDDGELDEVYNTERHFLYVACTRARDHLLVTSGGVSSEFLDDLEVR